MFLKLGNVSFSTETVGIVIPEFLKTNLAWSHRSTEFLKNAGF